MAIADDVVIDYDNKIIEIKNNIYTVKEFYSYLMETFDESGQMDDLIPMSAKTPTLYQLDNGWTLSTLSFEFLKSSAIQDDSLENIWTNVQSLGAVQTGLKIYISQGGTITFDAPYPFILSNTVDPTSTEVILSTTIPPEVPTSGELIVDFWGQGTGPETISYDSWATSTFTLTAGSTVDNTYNPSNNTIVIHSQREGHIDILLQTTENSIDISGATFSTWGRQFQDTYDKFVTTGGAIVANIPLATGDDANLNLSAATLDAYSGITIEWYTGSEIKRSAFDGTVDVQEYTMESSIGVGDTTIQISNTIHDDVATSGYLQIENEVIYYATVDKANSIFTGCVRGTFDTSAAGHLANTDLSTYMFDYDVLLQDTGSKTLKQLFNWIQYQLLKDTDIDDAGGTKVGRVTNEIVIFTGQMFTLQGVWVEGFDAGDANNIQFRDTSNVLHSPPLAILLKITCPTALENGYAAMFRLDAAYDPATYTPANVVAILINEQIDATGVVQKNIKFVENWDVVTRVRKAGYIPYEIGGTITSAGLTVTSSNPTDTVYEAP